MEAKVKEEEWKTERDAFREMQQERDFNEEQFLRDQHTYQKEIEGLRDANLELNLK